MKNMKKIFSMVLAVVMVLALSAPVLAADTYTLTIDSNVAGHTYEAYQIFAGELGIANSKEVLSNIVWGTGVDTTKEIEGVDLLEAINAKFGQSFTDAAEVAKWLSDDVTSDSATLDSFADLVGNYLGTVAGTSSFDGTKYTVSGLAAGYYLVKDKDGTQDGQPDAYTKYILRVLKNQTVTPKSDTVTVEKTINDTLNGTYAEHEDFDITDTAYYKWVGTLPSNLASYETYYYKFTDTLPIGIDTDVTVGGVYYGIQQIYIEGHDGNVVHVCYDITDADTANDTLPAGITLNYTNGEYERDADGNITGTVTAEKIELEFADLKALHEGLLATQKIVVKYTAFVNRDALVSAYGQYNPMENQVYLEFSNEPNGDGIGKTVSDEAYAFTFRFDVDKYDADNQELKLEGAEFILYYERTEGGQTVKYYAQVVTEEMIAEGVEINGKAVTQSNLGNIWGWTTDRAEASILDTDANGFLTVGGLDKGIYYLEETKAPAGYNLMESPVQIKITPSYDAEGNLVAVDYYVDSIHQSSATVGIRNDSGSTLPVTGGMGTTLFYIFGSVMVIGSAVLLITKKRMAA